MPWLYRQYVTNGNSVSVIDSTTNTVVASIPVGTGPEGIAFNPNNGDMYVANEGSFNVSVIAPLTATFSNGYNGMINAGQAATCTITNTFGK
jgi:YVTN family beta-propeller protein